MCADVWVTFGWRRSFGWAEQAIFFLSIFLVFETDSKCVVIIDNGWAVAATRQHLKTVNFDCATQATTMIILCFSIVFCFGCHSNAQYSAPYKSIDMKTEDDSGRREKIYRVESRMCICLMVACGACLYTQRNDQKKTQFVSWIVITWDEPRSHNWF